MEPDQVTSYRKVTFVQVIVAKSKGNDNNISHMITHPKKTITFDLSSQEYLF